MTTAFDTEEIYTAEGVLVLTGEEAGYGEVLIDHTYYPLAAPISEQNLATFQGKSTTGDYTEDSNPLLSSWVVTDMSGGLGVEEMNIVSDPARYRIGLVYPRNAKQIAPTFRDHTIDPAAELWTGSFANADIRLLGDMKVSGTFKGYVSIDGSLYNLAGTTSIGNLTTDPTGKAAVFRGLAANERLVIPLGAAGYATLLDDGTTFAVTAPVGTTYPALLASEVWDDKLVGIDTSGYIWYTVDLTGAWTRTTARLPRAGTPRCLVPFFERQIGAPAVFAISDTEIYQYDHAGPSLYPVNARWAPHPDHGLCGIQHDGDMFVAVGMGVRRYTNGSFLSVGLDQRDGLPLEYQGAIVDMVSESESGMFALVGKGTDYQDLDWRDANDTTAFRPSLHIFTGAGWHMIWAGDEGDDAVVNSMFVSRAEHDLANRYRLYWGVKNATGCALHYIDLPRTWATAKQRARVTGGFAPYSWFETSWFDAGMSEYSKLFSAISMKAYAVEGGGRITVSYKVDDDDNNWVLLGATKTSGRSVFQYGDDTSGVFSGIVGERLKYRVEMENPNYHGMYIRSLTTGLVKLVRPSDAWRMQLNLNTPCHDLSPHELWMRLKTVLSRGTLVPLTIGGETKRVLLSQISRQRQDGLDGRQGIVPLSVLEVPAEIGLGHAN